MLTRLHICSNNNLVLGRYVAIRLYNRLIMTGSYKV